MPTNTFFKFTCISLNTFHT